MRADVAPPEYDAFGNPIREGGSTASIPEPQAAPLPEPEPGQRTVSRRRSWVAPAFTVLALVALGLMLWSSERHALDSPDVVVREVDGHALAQRSLLRAANLRRALDAVQARLRPGEQVTLLRLEPEGLRVNVRDDRGRARTLTADVTFGVDARDNGTDTSTDAFGLEIVSPAAVERIVRETLRQAKAGDTNVSYLGLSTGDPPNWTIGLEDVRIADRTWVADLQGLAVTHPGELPFAAGIAGRSLIRPENLAKALARVQREGTRMTTLRLAPDRLDATVRRGGGTRAVNIDAALRVTTRDSPGAGSRGSVRVADVPPDGLQRAVQRIRAKAGVSPSRIGYAVISPRPPEIELPTRWTIFYDEVGDADRAWTATLDGRKVRPL
jgi:hypothetical protein